MSKRKCSELDELNYLKKKLKILETKLKEPRHRRIRIIDDSSSSSDEAPGNRSPTPDNRQGGETDDPLEPQIELLTAESQDASAPDDNTSHAPDDNPGAKNEDIDGGLDANSSKATPPSETALDSIILDILGIDPAATTNYGKEIHDQLASRFEHFATKGLTKDARKELNDKYLVPSNCIQIDAPILNDEIKAALNDQLVKRDKAIEVRQKLIAKAISALATAITDEINTSTDKNQELLKKLMDVGRLLCDIQHSESLTRRNFALYSVKKDLKEHLLNTKIDKHLFGANLSDTLKTEKAVCKSGTELKTSTTNFKKPAPAQQRPQPAKNLNWKPPVPARRQQGPQRSREPAARSGPPSSSKPSPRPYRSTRRQ